MCELGLLEVPMTLAAFSSTEGHSSLVHLSLLPARPVATWAQPIPHLGSAQPFLLAFQEGCMERDGWEDHD